MIDTKFSIIEDFKRLDALYNLQILDTPPEEAFDRLTRMASKILKAPVALLSLVDHDRQFFKSSFGLPEPYASDRETPLSHSFCQHIVISGKPLIVENATEHELVKDNLAIEDLDVIAYAGVPLQTVDGHVLGAFCVIDSVPRVWSEDELSLLADLSKSVMTEIELRAELIARHRSQEHLRNYATEMERINEELDAYTRMIAHDLKDPLNNIVGFAGVAQLYLQDAPEHIKEVLNNIMESGHAMADMIDKLLYMAKLRDISAEIVEVNTNTAAKKAIKRFEQRLFDAKIEVRLDGDLLPVLGYAPWVEEIFANLIANAINYRDVEKHDTLIAIRCSLEGDSVRFEVEDNGVGIRQQDKEKLFKAFSRLKTVHGVKGTGLGLSIVSRIVSRLNGTIGVESEFGVGTTFWFNLPAV